jgi:hypothetical protein
MIKIEMSTENKALEPRTKLTVYHISEVKGTENVSNIVLAESDGGEPEDNSFDRDWNWVPEALEKMYQLGKSDGALLTAQEIATMIGGK